MAQRCGARGFCGKLITTKVMSLAPCQTLPSPYNTAPYDEISISELLLKLWAKRGLIVMLPLIFAGLTVIGLLISKGAAQSEVTSYIELRGITLSGATDDSVNKITTRYPNGTIFSPQDLTNPTVITLLAEEAELDPQALAENIDVQFGTPLTSGVLLEYRAALSTNTKASAEDLASLNARYQSKLDATAKRGIKITVNYGALGVSLMEGERVAASLPKFWNRVYTEQFSTQISSDVATLRWTEYSYDLTSAIGLQEADIQLENLKTGVELLAADDRLKGIKNLRAPLQRISKGT